MHLYERAKPINARSQRIKVAYVNILKVLELCLDISVTTRHYSTKYHEEKETNKNRQKERRKGKGNKDEGKMRNEQN
jgi:hypothetical protein